MAATGKASECWCWKINEQFVIVGSRHPWWERKSVRLDELDGQSMVMRQRTSRTARVDLSASYRLAALQVRVAAEFDNVGVNRPRRSRRQGYHDSPTTPCTSNWRDGAVTRGRGVTGEPLQRTLKLVWNQSAFFFSPVTRSFLHFLEQYLPTLREMKL